MHDFSMNDLAATFSTLTPAQQAEVWGFIHGLKAAPSRDERNKAILELAGSISKEDLEIMKSAIEEDCERIDADGW